MRTRLFSLIAVLTLLVGVIAYAKTRRTQSQLNTGVTIEYNMFKNGQLTGTSLRYVKANGDYLEDTNYLNPDGTSRSHLKFAGTAELGAVSINEAKKTLRFLGAAYIARQVSESQLKAAQSFNREDSLLGYKAIVSRSCDATGESCDEYWVSADLGGQLLKSDIGLSNGGRLVMQATKITLGEPSFTIPSYPVDRSQFEQMQAERSSHQR